MNYLLEVCLIALTLPASIPRAVAQAPVDPSKPTPRQGISVKMPVAGSAVMLREADKEDALVVTVTENGGVYLGVNPIAPAALTEKLKARTSKVYIKADSRAAYSDVANVLTALQLAGVDAASCLTAQPEKSRSGAKAWPRGFEVGIGPPVPSNSVELQVLGSQQGAPIVKINHDFVPSASLQSTLQQRFKKASERVVLVKADGALSFGEAVHVADICRSTGARIFLVTS